MRSLIPLFLGMSVLAFTACRGGKTQSVPNYAKTEIAWPGVAAEDLKSQLMAMPTLRMAIVWDEKAHIYHEGSEEVVTAELTNAEANWPAEGPTLGETLWIDGMLPEPPPPVEEPKIRFQLDSEKMRALGLLAIDVANSMEELNLSPDDLVSAAEAKPKLAGKTVTNRSGTAVSLTKVVTIKMPEVWRPLIVDRR